jgi:cyclophilin family peptidyl-prolyl cis-trans isomerase
MTGHLIGHRQPVIQGGDPTGTGSGGSPLGDFDDQFHVDLQHNRTGILSMAKSFDDTNDSQFFITEGAQRHLDFNHSIFGILVEGESVRQSISGCRWAPDGAVTNVDRVGPGFRTRRTPSSCSKPRKARRERRTSR